MNSLLFDEIQIPFLDYSFLVFYRPSTSTKPLEDLKFVIVGKTSKSKAELTKSIQAKGGIVQSKPDAKTAACISTKGKDEVVISSVKSTIWTDIFFIKKN